MSVDREQVRRMATGEHYWTSPERTAYEYATVLADVLAELEQAERERDEARERCDDLRSSLANNVELRDKAERERDEARKSALAFEKWAEEETVARDAAEAQLAKVPALVEAAKEALEFTNEAYDYGCEWPIGLGDDPQEQRGGPRDTLIANARHYGERLAAAVAAFEQEQNQ